MAQLFSLLPASPSSPISLVPPQPATTVPVGNTPLCISHYVFFLPRDFKYPGLSSCGAGFPALGGERAMKLKSLICLSSKVPVAAAAPGSRHQARAHSSLGPRSGPRDLTIPRQSPYHLFYSISLASKLHTSWDSVLQKIGWVSQLGARVSGFSSHLPHCHLPVSPQSGFLND